MFSLRSLLTSALMFTVLAACSRNRGLPKPDSPQYRELVSAFYVGLAGLETGEDVRARQKLTLATQIAPGEPASWADLGLLEVRQQEFDGALAHVRKALELAPDNSRLESLLGLIESRRGNLPEAIAHLRKAVSLDPGNLKALYALAEQTERQAGTSSDAEARGLFADILKRQPSNLAVQLEIARLAAKRGDGAALQKAVAAVSSQSGSWPEEAKQRLTEVEQASAANPRSAAIQVAFLRNLLVRVPEYRESLNEVRTPASFVSEPFVRFVKLPSPASEPAPPDIATTFSVQPVPGVPGQGIVWIGALPLEATGNASVLWADQKAVHTAAGAELESPGSPGLHSVVGADLNYDFKTDLVLAGPSGVRLYEQANPSHFADVTAKTKLPPAITRGAYLGAWPFDVDLDGDLDIVLGVGGSDPLVLRNNGDGTFATVRPFPGVPGLVSFAAADIDGDGDPDAAMIGQDGRLHVFTNERLGQFRSRPLAAGLDSAHLLAVAAADLDGDGLPDFILLRDDGAVLRLADRNYGRDWQLAELIKPERGNPPEPELLIADLDNNGSLDLVVGGNCIYLSGANGFTRLGVNPELASVTAVDLNGDGRLDLLGLSRSSGKPVELLNHGVKGYRWQVVRTRAAKANGDQRINSFGLGGEVEIRSGLLTQKQIITSPLLHFGLGEHTMTDVARIVWPNGLVQAEFELPSDRTVLATQRLKGSCPWLFAWDGKQMHFVKDGEPWSPALGLHINAQVVAGIYQTQEWFKIPGEQLAPHDGYYDLRVTAELWETYYIDHYSLLVVDHPVGTEIYSDERFAVPPPPLKLYTTAEPQPFACARDDNGTDVSAIVHDLDGLYLDTFGRGQYQGVTRDHWVELELPENAPRTGPLYLIGDGWMHPTDATVNIALGQNSEKPPEGLSIEVPDASGRWVTARKGLGFPAGKMKTVVLDLTGLFRPGAPRKFRLRTNLEIYWDKLQWAAGIPDRSRTSHLQLSGAELRYRGFSVVSQANPSSPEIPDYNHLAGTAPVWRDLEGYTTRYGDVRELLEKIDDRIVITNAGDELRLRFPEQPPPPAGWKRDFIMIGDGWIKDGDYNSVFSKTVLPLPYHGMKDYTVPPGKLEDDPAYRRHPGDWQKYHTRYVTPEFFIKALRN